MLNKIKVQTKISIQILIVLAINFGIVSNSFGFTKIESKEFGRLFTTQEQRARMDNVLKSKIVIHLDLLRLNLKSSVDYLPLRNKEQEWIMCLNLKVS